MFQPGFRLLIVSAEWFTGTVTIQHLFYDKYLGSYFQIYIMDSYFLILFHYKFFLIKSPKYFYLFLFPICL